jgi:hypothetical protein
VLRRSVPLPTSLLSRPKDPLRYLSQIETAGATLVTTRAAALIKPSTRG